MLKTVQSQTGSARRKLSLTSARFCHDLNRAKPVHPVSPYHHQREENQTVDSSLNRVWIYAPGNVSVPRQCEKSDYGPESIYARSLFRARSANIKGDCEQPETAFYDQGRGHGVPKSQSVNRRRPRGQRHIRIVAHKIEQPVAKNGCQQQPRSPLITPPQEISRCE